MKSKIVVCILSFLSIIINLAIMYMTINIFKATRIILSSTNNNTDTAKDLCANSINPSTITINVLVVISTSVLILLLLFIIKNFVKEEDNMIVKF